MGAITKTFFGQDIFKNNTLSFFAIVLSFFFLFYNLGSYPLWDDEALIGLYAQNILKSGDTSAYFGDNIIAYRGGILLSKGFDRAIPPLASYVTAASFSIFGVNAFAARLPFAMIAFGGIIMSLWILKKHEHFRRYELFFTLSLIGCTPLFLFSRQCRYYALVIVFSLAIFYLISSGPRGILRMISASFVSVLLFASNYMNWVVLMAVVVLDFLIFRKYHKTPSLREAAWFFFPQAILILLIGFIWNPLQTQFGKYGDMNSVSDRLKLLCWNFRDLDSGGFMPATTLLLIPIFAFLSRDIWLIRGSICLCLYTSLVALVSPQLVSITNVADIRYLVAILPLIIALNTRFFGRLACQSSWLIKGIVAVLLLTNLMTASFFLKKTFTSHPLNFARELFFPLPDPFSPTADWFLKHAPQKSSVWIVPDYMAYPLMFRAPHIIYAWQLEPSQKPDPQFRRLADIHFKGLAMPDYIVAFGPVVQEVRALCSQWAMQGVCYVEEARLLTFWKDLYRPELFWRTFKPIEKFDPNTEAIYIFQKQP